MATPSFSVTVGTTYLTINIKNAGGYYLRFYVKDTDGTQILDNKWITGSASGNAQYVNKLSEGTEYIVNVAYNTSASAEGSTWIGSKTVTTKTSTYYYSYEINVYLPNNNLYDIIKDLKVQGSSTGATISLNSLKTSAGGDTVGGYDYDRYSANSYCRKVNGGIELYDTAHTAIVNLGYGPKLEAKITYYPNTGTGNSTTKTYTSSSSPDTFTLTKLSTLGFYKTNYRFSGWATSYNGEVEYSDGGSVELSTEKHALFLYAKWELNTYIVYFNGNGGSGIMNPQTYTYGKTYTLPVNAFTKKYTLYYDLGYNSQTTSISGYYTFAYWTPGEYKDKASVYNLTTESSITLTANWKPPTIYLQNPSRTGYKLDGWYDQYGYKVGNGGDTFTIRFTSETLYAQWSVATIAPTITATDHTDTTISVTLSRNNATTGTWVIEASTSNNFSTIASSTSTTSTTATAFTLSGLKEDTSYYLRARHVIGDLSASSAIISYNTRIAYFYWTTNDSTYVQAGQDFSSVVTATKWNDLSKRIKWCRAKKSLYSISLEEVDSGQTMTATLFNATRNAIADMTSVVSTKSSGEEAKATYFANNDTSLKSAINNVISTL